MGMKFDENVLVVVATAPAGLGHIRVTNALQQGLSEKTRLEVMGISDSRMQWIHRLTSQNTILKKVMEFTQENRLAEQWFSGHYRKWLRSHTDGAAQQLIKLVSTAWPQPEKVVVVATHFGLAHQLAAAKATIQRKLGGTLLIAVVVTDDSPQEMWAVADADMIFVPSNTTREILLSRLMEAGGVVPEVITVPYPTSPWLGERLSQEEIKDRQRQLRGKNLQMIVPVSGAAVQLTYFQELIGVVTADYHQTTVVSRESDHTHEFLQWCRERQGVVVVADTHDPEVVAAYDETYMDAVIGAEITKPSEQAFKALFTPFQRGGSILLFSPPVGRQEKDNLAFLRRHRLIPSVDDQARLMEWCLKGNRLHITPALLARAHHWRGALLPADGMWAGVAIKRLVEGGVLAAMGQFEGFLEGHDEIRSDGVKVIWQTVANRLSHQDLT